MDPASDITASIESARRGDRRALHELVEACRPKLLERIRLMMGSDARRIAESGDFVQSVVVDALEHARTSVLSDPAQLLRWMTAAARNNIRDDVRKRRESALESLSHGATWSAPDRSGERSPATQADMGERLEVLVETLEGLTDEQRRVIELRELEQKTFGEIAALLGGTDDRVRLVHAKALVRLGEQLARRGL